MQGIKKKLLTSFFTVISVLLISEVFFVVMNSIILAKYTSLTSNITSEYRLIEETSSLLSSFNKRLKYPADTVEVENFNLVYSGIKNLLSQLEKNISDNGSRAVFIRLENNINDVFFDVEIGVSSLATGDYSEAANRYEIANRKNSFIRENVVDLLLKEAEYAKNLQVEIENVRVVSEIIALCLLLLTAGGCVWYAIAFSNKLVAPLISLNKTAKIIEDGDLNVEMEEGLMDGDDEISSLAKSAHTMVESLKSNIKKLQEYNNEIKNSQNNLKAEKKKLQQYLDIAGIIVLIFDSNNNVLLINRKGREILGIETAEIFGKDWVERYVLKKDQTRTRSFLASFLGKISPTDTLENVLVSKDKSEKNIVWHFSAFQNEKNVSPAVLATGVDVTELTRARVTIDQLKEVDKLKSEVLNIATHELKTPLISIVGLSEVMEKQPKEIPEEYKGFISIIHNEGVKLTNLIKTMLTASRNELGKASAVIEEFDLVGFVKSLEISLGIIAKRTDSQVKLNLRAPELIIESDKAKISQVIYNFVDNAIKYGPTNQVVGVNLFLVNNKSVRIEVRGTGEGIPKEKQEKLFMKFSQLEPSLSRSQDGMGLGLYICKQNIENLGGQIGVESELNQGTNFFFTLPINSKTKL